SFLVDSPGERTPKCHCTIANTLAYKGVMVSHQPEFFYVLLKRLLTECSYSFPIHLSIYESLADELKIRPSFIMLLFTKDARNAPPKKDTDHVPRFRFGWAEAEKLLCISGLRVRFKEDSVPGNGLDPL